MPHSAQDFSRLASFHVQQATAPGKISVDNGALASQKLNRISVFRTSSTLWGMLIPILMRMPSDSLYHHSFILPLLFDSETVNLAMLEDV